MAHYVAQSATRLIGTNATLIMWGREQPDMLYKTQMDPRRRIQNTARSILGHKKWMSDPKTLTKQKI